MFEAIGKFLQQIVDFFTTLFDFVIQFFSDIGYVVQTVTGFLAKIPSLFSWMPNSVLVLIVALFSLVVVYKILGREG